MEYDLAIKMNKVVIHSVIFMNIESIMLSEFDQTSEERQSLTKVVLENSVLNHQRVRSIDT